MRNPDEKLRPDAPCSTVACGQYHARIPTTRLPCASRVSRATRTQRAWERWHGWARSDPRRRSC